MNHEKPLTIDAHQHFWDFHRFSYPWMTAEMKALQRSFLPSDLRPLLNRSGFDRTVFVQSQHSLEETEWALQLAAENPWIAGVVGWVDLKSPSVEQQLDRFHDQPKLVGIRHIVHDEPDDRWLLDSDVIRGLTVLSHRNLTYDLLVRPHHLPYVKELRTAFLICEWLSIISLNHSLACRKLSRGGRNLQMSRSVRISSANFRE